MGYIRPVPYTGMSTWTAHTNRGVPSSEPGVDYYCRIGTPVVAAGAGVVRGTFDGIEPATGRFVMIDLDDGRRCRYLHLSRRLVSVGDRVGRGQIIGYSGATGYGTEDWSADPGTGGAHVHFTLWRTQEYRFGRYATLDPEPYMDETPKGAAGAGSGGVEFDDMGTIDDTDANYEWLAKSLARAFRWDVRVNGVGGAEKGPSVFDLLAAADDSDDISAVKAQVSGIKADINYIHQLSPYSLKAILEASGRGEVKLTAEQTAAIGGQLSAAAVAGIEAALKDDFAGVVTRLNATLPTATVAALKAAL